MKELLGYRILRGKIHVETGIHIGAGRESMEIGGVEPPIMRHPLTQQPYIPGSSLKGKVRCLLELKYCVKDEKCLRSMLPNDKEDPRPLETVMKQAGEWKPCGCGECDVCIVFGSSKVDTTKTMTRVIFRDAFMTPEATCQRLRARLPSTGRH
jgi:CRISPR-associated protein Csm3